MAGKLGRQPAVFTARSVASASAMAATLDRLGTPPSASVDRVSAIKDWGLLGNDLYGCCFQADVGHSLMLRSAAEGALVTPTEDDVLALYKAIAGFDGSPETDHGTSELAGCIYLERTGFLGHKATAFSNISTSNHNHLRWAIELFGHCRLGVNLHRRRWNSSTAASRGTWCRMTAALSVVTMSRCAAGRTTISGA